MNEPGDYPAFCDVCREPTARGCDVCGVALCDKHTTHADGERLCSSCELDAWIDREIEFAIREENES